MGGKFVMTHGLPGSGKSTWAEEQVRNDPTGNTIRVNRDDIRTELFGESYHKGNPDRKKEGQVTQVQEEIISRGLREGKRVICDDTNLNTRFSPKMIMFAKKYGAEIEQKHFNVPVDECKRRNAHRASQGGRFVPEEVIDSMAKSAYGRKGNLKTFIYHENKGQGNMSSIDPDRPGKARVDSFNEKMGAINPMKGKAVVVVDMDGTLFDNEKDSQKYLKVEKGKKKDFHGFYTSITKADVNEGVRDFANSLRDNENINIIGLTGRSDDYAKELISAIERSGIKMSRLVMKAAGDFRPSNLHKSDQVDALQKEGLVIVQAIDDREQDIVMFASKGIAVTHVAPADGFAQPQMTRQYGPGTCMRCGSKLKDSTKTIGDECKRKLG